MDDLGGLIGQILNDPDRLQQVMDVAKNLLPQDAAVEEPAIDQERIHEIGKLLQNKDATEQKQEALMQALRPYLRPGRRSKLDRAMQIARLSHIAGIALKKDLIP